jgi:hypothetical protein
MEQEAPARGAPPGPTVQSVPPVVLTAALRVLAAVLVVGAVGATLASTPTVVLVNFFGYFTVQGNLIGAVVAAVGAVRLLRGTAPTTGWMVVRWCAATYLVVVGLVYWALLAPLGAAGGVPVPWANLVLHGLVPLLALIDLLVAPDRLRPPLRLLPVVLAYPLVWTAVVLVRGATDGWVPYPFMDPEQGGPVLTAWVLLVAGVFTSAAALLRLGVRPAARRSALGAGAMTGRSRAS